MSQPETPLIPREILFGNPDRAMAKLSPDGAKLAYLAPVEGVLNVWVGPADNLDAARPVTNDTDRGIRFYGWAYTNDHIFYIQDKGGDENWRLYCVELSSGQSRDLTPLEEVQVRFQEVSPKFPEEILIGLNERDPRFHDIYRINLLTGQRRLIQKNEGFAGFTTDDDYNVRFAMRTTDDGGGEMFKLDEDGEPEPFLQIAMEDIITTWVVGLDKSGRQLYLIDSRGRNTAALTALNLETGRQTVLAEDPRADVSGVMRHPTEKHVQAVAFTYQRKEWQILDDAVAADFDYLRTVAGGDIELIRPTLDNQHWIVVYVLDNGPVHAYVYDRRQRKAHFLFTNRQDLEGVRLANMEPVVIKARDGLELISYYTLPPGSDRSGDGRPDNPLPLVLNVHGGPWSRDGWGFNATHQWLANRGYAALSVNFRGSTGFGKSFVNASNGQWGAKMHDDLIDAVEWAIQAGIADPERIAIMGGSYGGYATLAGLTFTPERFTCGVDIVGPSNLITLLETIPPYWEPRIAVFTSRVGDHRTEEGRALLTERSPLTHVDRIRRPLLIGQGANDPRVKQAESDQIVEAMQEKGIPVTYALFPDEGHGFAKPENRLAFLAVAEAFLARCLGGRREAINDDFKGASIEVPVGAEDVPGLEEALDGLQT